MYLLHVPIQLVLLIPMRANGFTGPSASVPFLLTYLSVNVIAAAVCHTTLERPLSRLIRRRHIL